MKDKLKQILTKYLDIGVFDPTINQLVDDIMKLLKDEKLEFEFKDVEFRPTKDTLSNILTDDNVQKTEL